MHREWGIPSLLMPLVAAALAISLASEAHWAWGADQTTRAFSAVVTDAQGVETELKDVLFYWEEKVSETSFVPHEVKQVPVKRGTGTVKVNFATIRQIDVQPSPDGGLPRLTITLTSGKTGEFTLASPGSFKGESDFGEMNVPASGITRIVFK
ncbi:MAG: hypothetical protein ACE5NA_03980 [Nitrospiraceae bacterium]